MKKNKVKELILFKYPGLINFGLAFIAGLLGYMKMIVLDNIDMFRAVFFVVMLDFGFGVWKALKFNRFRTRKAMKIVYYLSSYWAILFVVLTIEHAHESTFWLSEAVFVPIIVFQVISALKNASLVGAIPQGLLLKILESIDKHKSRAIENIGESVTEKFANKEIDGDVDY